MLEKLIPVIAVLLILGLLWGLLKFILRITTKIFTWGCLILIIIGAIALILGGNFPTF